MPLFSYPVKNALVGLKEENFPTLPNLALPDRVPTIKLSASRLGKLRRLKGGRFCHQACSGNDLSRALRRPRILLSHVLRECPSFFVGYRLVYSF